MLHTAERYFLEENYPSAIVEAFSAFELFVERFLMEVLLSNGVSKEIIEETMNQNKNWQIQVRVKSLFKDITGIDLSNTKEYQAWTSTKNLRDKIVHSGLRNITEDQAFESLRSIKKFMDLIKK